MCDSDSGKKLRVLIADDEKIIADTLKLILTQVGYDVAVAYDGSFALEMARQWQPDIFLSDVWMPGLNGIDAAIQICSLLPRCKVLLFSGQSDLQDLRNEIRSKCQRFDVISKPVHPIALMARLAKLR